MEYYAVISGNTHFTQGSFLKILFSIILIIQQKNLLFILCIGNFVKNIITISI